MRCKVIFVVLIAIWNLQCYSQNKCLERIRKGKFESQEGKTFIVRSRFRQKEFSKEGELLYKSKVKWVRHDIYELTLIKVVEHSVSPFSKGDKIIVKIIGCSKDSYRCILHFDGNEFGPIRYLRNQELMQ